MSVRRAEWRLREGERWTVWRLFGQSIWRGTQVAGLALLAVLVCIGASVATHQLWLLLVAVLIPVPVIVWPRKPVSARIRDLAPQPSDCPQHAVILRVEFEDVWVGSDEGVLAFVDGWMYFEGLRTSFALQSIDICGSYVRARGLDGVQVTLTGSPRGTLLTISPITPFSNLNGDRSGHALLAADFRKWKWKDYPSDGESVYPPDTIHPMADAEWRLFPVASVALFAALTVGLVRTSFAQSGIQLLILLVGLGTILSYYSVTYAARRRKLKKAVPNLPSLHKGSSSEDALEMNPRL